MYNPSGLITAPKIGAQNKLLHRSLFKNKLLCRSLFLFFGGVSKKKKTDIHMKSVVFVRI